MSKGKPKRIQAALRAVLHENPWFRLLKQDVELPDSSHCDYFTLDFKKPVVAIVARRGSEYLLVHQDRFIIGQMSWEIPAGFAEEGEALEDAVRRELLEETGFTAKRVTHMMTYYPSDGTSNQRFEAFLAEEVEHVTDAFDENEVTEHRWFPQKEVERMIRSNEIVDGLTLPALLRVLWGRDS